HRYAFEYNFYISLKFTHSIPIQSIATNGPSLVHKVRFVASTLLDAVSKAETAPVSAARAHGYLCKRRPVWLSKTQYLYRGLPEYLVRDRTKLSVRYPSWLLTYVY